jgi:hypothetical protein
MTRAVLRPPTKYLESGSNESSMFSQEFCHYISQGELDNGEWYTLRICPTFCMIGHEVGGQLRLIIHGKTYRAEVMAGTSLGAL